MDPDDVDRRFAELVTTEFGEQAWREPKDAPRAPDRSGPVGQDPESHGPVRYEPVEDEPGNDDVDYRRVSAPAPLPADVRIAVILSAAGLVGLLLAGFVVNLPANLVWLAPAAAGGGVVWLLVRAMRRPPRDPDDGSGAVL
ncbi:hypothetical protein [Aestuariimicrobium kwangyangense]|uniref:hypothetical protein n=1 Tax=Aestuariimicrobium kwangyangense TaxID=396389 RepID=UPI0003B79103|nr:hypothetical protein [Aestuariimicrobium kwangyangense]